MRFSSQFVFAVLIVTLAVLVSQSYSMPPSFSEAETAEIDEVRMVKRGFFDCPHNCWGNISKLNIGLCYQFWVINENFSFTDTRDERCSNPNDRFVSLTFLPCYCCRYA